MISPRTGRNVRARARARIAVVFALAFGLVATPQLIAPHAAIADTTDTDDAGTVGLSLIAGMHGVMPQGGALTVVATVDNETDDAVAAGRVTVELNRTPLADSASLTAWLDEGDAAGSFTPLAADDYTEVPGSGSTTVSITAPATALSDLPAGVYPLRGSMPGIESTIPLTARNVLIVNADSTTQITVLVPITASPADGALLTADELTALTAPDGALTAQLDGVAGTSAVLAVDPLIPAAIRVLGSAAPASATEWLTRLDSLTNERFALQPGDADATVQARAGLPSALAPLPLTSYLDRTNFVAPDSTATPAPSETPVPTPSPTAPELPDYADLAAVPDAIGGILWPLGDVQTVDLSTFDAYLGTDVTTVLPSTSLAATASALVTVDSHRVLAVNAAASASLSDAAAAPDDATREREIAAGIAELSFAGNQTSQLVGLDRDETRSADSLREAILSLSTIAQPTTLAKLRSSAPTPDTIVGDATDARATALENLLADEERLTAFASILDDPDVLLSPERLKILRLIAVGTADEYPDAVAGHRAATTKTLDAVGVQQPSTIQLFTAAAPLPVWVRNDLPWPVNVTLESRPSDARLDVRPRIDVTAQPASNTRVKVPVEARVGSGELVVHFALSSPTGVHIGTDQTANVTVRAEWESIGLVVLGSVIALLLVLGVIRTVVRRRKGHETDAAAE